MTINSEELYFKLVIKSNEKLYLLNTSQACQQNPCVVINQPNKRIDIYIE